MKINKIPTLMNYGRQASNIKDADEIAKTITICDCCGYEVPCGCGMSVYGTRTLYDYWKSLEKEVTIPKFLDN
jgi:hypothetical protein